MTDFDDRGDPRGSEADVDRLLRREFDRSFGGGERPLEVLENLRPSLRRAHTIHRIQRAAAGAAAAALLMAGVVGAARLIPSSEVGSIVAGDVDGATTGDGAQHSDDQQQLAVNGTTTTSRNEGAVGGAGTDDTATGNAGTGNTGAESTTGPVPSPSAPRSTTPTTRPSANATTGGTSSPTTDPDSSTSIRPDGSIVVITACGRVIVDLDGGDLTLVDVQPDRGYRSDVKESTRRLIEIGFEREGGHCEVKIRPSGTSLDVDAKTEGEPGHD